MSKNIPTNKKLYARVKAEAKRKFDRWPSAYGSAWLVKTYKKRGGGYRKAEMGMEVDDYTYGGMLYADEVYMYGGEDQYGYGGEDEYGYGGEDKYAKGGGIPQRYKNKGFTKVGAKKKSTRPGKKWMVLAKKGDKYKVVHGGYKGMKDFKQHGSAKRKKNFWDRMGGRDSAKAKDPFSPLYWHKRFGTWEAGGEFQPHIMYDPETGKGYEANKSADHERMKQLGYLHEDEMQEQGIEMMAKGGTNNPGFRSLPPEVQQNILDNMGIGGECYSCGGQKKYQFAGQTMEDPFTDEEVASMQPSSLELLPYPDSTGGLNVMYPNPNNSGTGEFPTMLDEVSVTADRMSNELPVLEFEDTQLEEVKDMIETETFLNKKQLEAKKKSEKKEPNYAYNALARIAAASKVNSMFENLAARKREAQQRQNLLTDNFVPMATGNDRGDYEMNTGIFKPDQYVPTQFKSQFAQGGQIAMVDEKTLKALIAAGADIELLD